MKKVIGDMGHLKDAVEGMGGHLNSSCPIRQNNTMSKLDILLFSKPPLQTSVVHRIIHKRRAVMQLHLYTIYLPEIHMVIRRPGVLFICSSKTDNGFYLLKHLAIPYPFYSFRPNPDINVPTHSDIRIWIVQRIPLSLQHTCLKTPIIQKG